MALGRVVWTYADYGGEKSPVSIAIPALDAGNIAAQLTEIELLETAIAGVTGGLQVKQTIVASENGSGSGKSTEPTAHREMKWLVTYADAVTGKPHNLEMPCPTLTAALLDSNSKDGADLSAAAWTSFISVFEGLVLAPDTENAVTVQSVRLVGRNI